jgi:hypothetical protein
VSDEAAPPSARYLRCRGGGWSDYPPGADTLFLRIVPFEGDELFEGYVVLDASGQVVEKTNRYGMYDGERVGDDPELEDRDHCTPIDYEAFLKAWRRPYAERSLRRRFLSWLNGCRDQEEPE